MRPIDADELKQTFYDNKKYHEEKHKGSLLIGFDFDKMINVIDNAPTINPEDLRPKGKWISKGRKLECSVCHQRVYLGTDEKIIHKIEKDVRKYCSWCGAKMEG